MPIFTRGELVALAPGFLIMLIAALTGTFATTRRSLLTALGFLVLGAVIMFVAAARQYKKISTDQPTSGGV